jgi:hypothetical protein
MAIAHKSSTKRSTKKRESRKLARFGIYRVLKRAELQTHDCKPLPLSVIPNILSLTGFSDLTSLKTEIAEYDGDDIPIAVHDRLSRLFSVKIDADAVDESLIIKVGRRSYELPYPFIADDTDKWDFDIAGIYFEENKRAGTFLIGVKICVEAPKFLKARTKEDEDFCALIAHHSAIETASNREKAIVSSWLTRHGVENSDAKIVLDNSDNLFDECCWDISSRIQSMLDVVAAPDLVQHKGGEICLNADDEYEGFITY